MKKTVKHNGNQYEVEAGQRFGSSMQIKVNGKVCEEIGRVGNVVDYAVFSENDVLLLLLIQDKDVYFYDLEPDTDVKAYAKILVGYGLPKWVKWLLSVPFLGAAFSCYRFVDYILDNNLWVGHCFISVLGMAFILTSFWRISEKISLPRSKRRKLYCIGTLLGSLFALLYNFLAWRLLSV